MSERWRLAYFCISLGRLKGWLGLGKRPSVLIIKPDSLGDGVLFLGALRRIRAHFSAHKLMLVCDQRTAEFYRRSKEVDHFFPLNFADQSLLGRLRRCRQMMALGSRHYEVLLHAAYSTEDWAHELCAALRSDRSIWFKTCEEDGLRACYSERVEVNCEDHELDKMLALLRHLKIPEINAYADIWPDILLEPADRAAPAAFRNACGQREDAVLHVAVCPGARFSQKDWGATNFSQTLRLLGERRALMVYLLGGPADRACTAQVLSALDAVRDLDAYKPAGNEYVQYSALAGRVRLVDLAGMTSVFETMAWIESADFCVGNDTFGLHVAVAVGTPSVVVMGGGDGDRWIPWGSSSRHAMCRTKKPCFHCGWQCPDGRFGCLQDVAPEKVVTQIETILSGLDQTRGELWPGGHPTP